MKKRRLKETINSIINYQGKSDEKDQVTDTKGLIVNEISTNLIIPNKNQPRKIFSKDDLDDLSISIQSNGILQPIIVRPLENKKFEIIAGERRWRAAVSIGMDKIPVVIKKLDKQEVLAVSLIENIQREQLNPIEEAKAFKTLIEEFGLTHKDVSNMVGKSREAITNLIRVLSLPEYAQKGLLMGKIQLGHAKTIVTCSAEIQQNIFKRILEQSLSVRQTEMLVRKMKGSVNFKNVHTSDKGAKVLFKETGIVSRFLKEDFKVKVLSSGKHRIECTFTSYKEMKDYISKLVKLKEDEIA